MQTPGPSGKPRPRRRTARALLILLALVAAAALYCRHIGYPFGPIYRIVPAARGGDGTVAVFMSGDIGFNTGMSPRIAARLADAGVPVLGVNSLTAFAWRRTPQQTDDLVRQAMDRALSLPGARRVVLIGQSFGANAVLAGIASLPPALRAKVQLVELVVPGQTMLLRATPGGVFDIGDDGPALPAARRLDWVPVLCVSGAQEEGSLCPAWRQPNVTRVTLPGDHYLHKDATLVAATLLRPIFHTADRRTRT